jgi:4-amino-4-deoxy-L-arabinose transferase-like glycosyltransferase
MVEATPAARAGIGGAALALALLGQALLDRRATFGEATGWLVLAGAAILAVWALGPRTLPAPPSQATPATERAGRRGLLILAGAVVCGIAALPGFVQLAQTGGQAAPRAGLPWLGWLLSIGLFLAAAAAGRQAGLKPAPTPQEHSGGLLVVGRPAEAPPDATTPAAQPLRARLWAALPWVAIIGAAAFLRLWQLDSVPRGLWADEAIAGLQAEDILYHGWRPLFIGGANGEPAFYLYGIAVLIKLLGPTVVAVRLPMALAGTLAVAALGWLAALLYGRRVALVAAALLAAMTWQINFSRIGFNAAWSLPVDLLAAGCLLRALATGRLGWYAGAGLLFGLGFQLYYISRAWLLLLAGLLLYRLLTERGLWRRARAGLVWTGLGLLLAAAPVLVYAVIQPADYAARAASVSIADAIQSSGSLAPLGETLLKHLRMWNVAGDFNGRHNLPDARMLDGVTAALLPVGLTLAVAAMWGRRRGWVLAWPYLFPVAGLLVLLAGGVLSNPGDTPQALRTLGDTSMVALLAALPLAAWWATLDGVTWRPRRRVAVGALAVLGVLLVVFALNYRRYFFVQEPNPAVYKEFSTPATLVYEMVAAQGPGTDYYLSRGLYEQATIEYLAGGRIGTVFSGLHETPLPPGEPGRPAMLFLNNRDSGALDWLRTLYPHAKLDSVTGPQGGNALFFAVTVPPADRAAPYQVAVTIRDAAGAQTVLTSTTGIDVDWGRAVPPGARLPLQVTWRGALRPPAWAVYHVRVDQSAGPADRAHLELAGRALDAAGADVPLIAGRYPFTLTATVNRPAGVTRLLWTVPAGTTGTAPGETTVPAAALLSPALGEHGVTAIYRQGTVRAGPVGLVREEPAVNWFHFYTPFADTGPFVGEWRGTLQVPQSGRYTFTADIGGTPGLWLDGAAVTWTPAGRSALNVPLYEATVTLAAGPHAFRFQDLAPGWREPCFLFWTPPGGTQQLIPAEAFRPELWPGEARGR